MKFIFIFFLTCLLSLEEVKADTSCYENDVSLETFTAIPANRTDLEFQLFSTNVNGAFQTNAYLHLTNRGSKGLELWFQFPGKPGFVSLPYNLYRLEVLDERSRKIYEYDLTANCQNVGLSLFPGQEIHLPTFKIPSHTSEWSRHKKIFLRVWGRL